MKTNTLEVSQNSELIFTSQGKWLHPLFEFEAFLEQADVAVDNLTLRDKIIGKAAALLIVRLGINTVFAGVLSEPGKAALETFGITFDYDTLVPRIACMTEELLQSVNSPEEAWQLLKARSKQKRPL
ncbi:DUF1893 domain-containing protein [bacterium]|nr:DUF1893 domain-containing protein [bacterium]